MVWMEIKFDLVVIGGGSGGIATSRRAAMYGKKVALIEKQSRLGGTCVNVGCIPKKVMWNTAHVKDILDDATKYGFSLENVKFDYKKLRQTRNEYIKRLNGLYAQSLGNSKVTVFNGFASFVDKNTVQVGDQKIVGEHILLAMGGRPLIPKVPGAEHGITSDEFFDKMEDLPPSACVVGAGYIAVELAGVLNTLGSKVNLAIRHDKFLRTFDTCVADHLMPLMTQHGITITKQTVVSKVEKNPDNTLKIFNQHGEVVGDYHTLIWAIGREPLTDNIGLDKVGVKLRENKSVIVDEWQATSVPNIFAVGDVIGQIDLTPVAIAAGRRLARRLYNKEEGLKLDYENVPSVIFSHPPVGSVGLSEEAARKKFTDVKVFTTSFTNTYHVIAERQEKTFMKLITVGTEEKIVGLHIIGSGADEMLQGFAVAIKMGATRNDFNETVAIHPTASEEVVLL